MNNSNKAAFYQTRSLGAYVQLEHLASFHVAAKHLPLKKNKAAISFLAGPYKTKIRGRGMEFEDVRQYQAGDDIRNIDWRVSARTGKAHTKVFHEEREKPVFIAIDQRQSMFFASQVAMKSVLAADLATYIAWAALNKGDRTGALIFNDNDEKDIRPRSQRKTVLQILHHLESFNKKLQGFAEPHRRHINDALLELKRVAKPGSQIFIISDFHDLDDSSSALLHDLSQHCELIALQVYDPLEQVLPSSGIYQASDGQQQCQFNAANKTTRTSYQQAFDTHQQHIKALLGKYRISLIPIATTEDPLKTLQYYFGNGAKPQTPASTTMGGTP